MDTALAPASDRVVARTDNRPPPSEVAGEHRPRVDKLVDAANAWVKQVPVVTTGEAAGKLEDFLSQLRAEWQTIDAARTEERKPHLAAAQAVQDAFNPLLVLIEKCGAVLKPLKLAYLAAVEARQKAAAAKAAEEARKAAEAAEMAKASLAAGLAKPVQGAIAAEEADARAEAAAVEAARAAAARPQISGELSGRASGFVKVWSAKIVDPEKAAVAFCRDAKVAEAIQAAANAQAKREKERFAAAGCEVVEGRRI